jgi:hypothetical protein
MLSVAPLIAPSVALGQSSADAPADVCLEVAGGLAPEVMSSLADAVAQMVAQNQSLFPQPQVTPTASGIDIHAGHPDLPARSSRSCLMPDYDWTARFARDFLVEGAELMLEQADRTPGFESSIDLEWVPGESRIRSTLTFSGPLGIPSGSCWVDDTLTVEPGTGAAVASADRGMDVSLFGDVVCDRFYGNLPKGGAGEQAVGLLPKEVAIEDGRVLRFVTETVQVLDDALVTAGTIRLE